MKFYLTNKEQVVLAALAAEGPQTVDEFVTSRRWYVNSWAPTFTHLRERELVERTGDTRLTTHGAYAHVCDITPAGHLALAQAKTRTTA